MALFKSLSHVILHFNTTEACKQSGIHAMMELCFGSDENAIAQILLRTPVGHKTPIWTLPFRLRGVMELPIFIGILGEEIMEIVGTFSDIFKRSEMGKRGGKKFRISKNGLVVEIKEKE